jgi:D-glycero-beta-D-manno-heptose-7-phosphate kinase
VIPRLASARVDVYIELMKTMTEERIDSILRQLPGKRIAVVGDLMVDRYYWGVVRRVSPEAPVPVVEVESESVRLGGAANVANNIQTLGGRPVVVGIVGDDHIGEVLRDLVTTAGFDGTGLVTDSSRPTTIKTRVIAQGQHVVRIDNESKVACSPPLRKEIVNIIRREIQNLDGIIIEDYNKGVVTREVIEEVIALARQHKKIITVDPKFDNFLDYKHVTVFKPNRREAEEVLGGRLRSTDEIVRAGKRLLELLATENVLLTRGEEGMSLFKADGEIVHLPSVATNVQDVSGAGDTVISTLTMALASGADIREACVLANCASGVVVGSIGIVPIRPDALRKATLEYLSTSGGR